MRPELDRRFCGRCGNPCGGYEEPARDINPPRICAECAIERRFFHRWVQILGSLITGIIFLGTTLLVLPAIPGILSQGIDELDDVFLLGSAVLAEFFTATFAFLCFRDARVETHWVRRVRRQNGLDAGRGPVGVGTERIPVDEA
ncbi:MAG: hypothetical protein HYY93_00030 [Planctomycetes bacterium]|nr:hypothetical protein [Planctomycetota bacterium]